MGDGAMRCVHAVGIGLVAVVVPEGSQEVLSTVFIPNIIVLVKCSELHVVEIIQAVTFRNGRRKRQLTLLTPTTT